MSAMTRSTWLRVSAATLRSLFTTRETVFIDTPASLATSSRVLSTRMQCSVTALSTLPTAYDRVNQKSGRYETRLRGAAGLIQMLSDCTARAQAWHAGPSSRLRRSRHVDGAAKLGPTFAESCNDWVCAQLLI